MGDYENVKAEEQRQCVILPCPNDSHQNSLTGESPLLNDSLNEKQSTGETDDMMHQSKEDQTILPAQRTSLPTTELAPLQITEVINQNVPCKTSGTEVVEKLKRDSKSDFPTSEADADRDPDYDPKINPDGNPQGSRMFFCQHCQRRFATKQGLERHMHAMSACHQQIFKCRFCRKCFSTQFCRRRHERRHNNGNRRTGGLVVSPAPQVHETEGIVSLEKKDQCSPTSQPVSNSSVPDMEGKGDSDELREKCLFACKYCKKAFGTHTSLRRHERRIHERRLLPRGVRQKVVNSHEVQIQNFGDRPEASSNAQHSNEVRQEEEYMVDISSNISENLSFYIDGKIISTSAVTNCEVMELNSAATVIGLDALIVNPAQITQTLKMESNDCNMTSDLGGQSSGRRRTSTPPLLPQIKTELESESILTTPSSNAEGTLIGTVFPRTLETIVLQKEKTIYLSPKLKQLLQHQDSSKSSFSLITEGQKLCPPLSFTLLPATSSRFKRRTTSPPPNSPQQSSASMLKSTVEQETGSSAPKVPKMDDHCTSTTISLSKKEQVETVNLATKNNDTIQQLLDCSASGTGGRSCNQQPLDLSSAVGKRECEILADCVLDLSMNRKSTETDSAGCLALQTSVRKNKPTSSMLEKVLLNQYAVVDVPAPADGIVTATDLAAMAVSEPVPDNYENLALEQPPPSPPVLDATPSLPNSAALHTSPPAQPIITTQEPTEIFLAAQKSITNQELHPICSTAQSSSPVVLSGPVELSVGSSLAAFNVSLPNWLNTAPGSVTHALIPTTPTISLQSPQFLTDASACDMAQRTLVIDSVLSPETQLISPVLVNQSSISSLSFSPNVVVIEYTVALESSNSTPLPQANAVDSHVEKSPPDHTETQKDQLSQVKTASTEPSVPEPSETDAFEVQGQALDSSSTEGSSNSVAAVLPLLGSRVLQNVETPVELANDASSTENIKVETSDMSIQHNPLNEEQLPLPPLCKRFMCNACDELFQSMKGLSQHIGEHSDTWPYKCEFCVQLFETDTDLFEHRSSYHGIGKIYVCKICSKEFAFLCNLEQHHQDLHPGQECSHTEVENGKLRPENHNSPVRVDTVTTECPSLENGGQSYQTALKPEPGNNSENTAEELYTTIKIMASEGVKPKGTDVRLGINQHYPSFKPPPFPYHNRTPVEPTTTATNFTTHNIPQTFSTTVRCTKCGRGFDNMPELHKHILACANASDKRRYTPKKNPIPLKQFAKVQNGVLLPARGVNLRQNVSQKLPKKLQCHESEAKAKLGSHSKRKSMWIQRGRPVGRKSSQEELEVYVCPHCSREFTYHTSLKKHIAFSCPMKPICRKPPKRKSSMAPTQENHGRIRTRVSEVIMKPQRLNHAQKSLAKTQTSEAGSARSVNLPVKAHIGKGKFTVRNYKPKTSDILSSSADHISKKSRLILMEAIQSPISSKSLVALGKSQQQTNGVHCLERKIKHRDMELKASTEEQFSLRVRGPITRSLQQVSSNVTANTNKKANSTNPNKSVVQTDDQNVTHQAAAESKK